MAKSKKKLELKLSERTELLSGKGAWTIRGNRRGGIEPTRVSDGPCGLRKVDDNDAMDITSPHQAIAYPCSAALACSWDPSLLKKIGVQLGKECGIADVQVLLGPGLNIKRNPLCGRNFEYYSEDPLLSGALASGFVIGLQSEGVGACLKHFCCNSQETYRMVNDSIVDERALREIYLRGFEIAIKESNPWALMSSYNKINGKYACSSPELLIDLVKKQWGFSGVIMSDWGGTDDAVAAHNAGLDVEMPCFENKRATLTAAVRWKALSEERVNDSVKRIMTLSDRTHGDKTMNVDFDPKAARKLAISACESSLVLLKNKDDALPFKTMKDIAIIGSLAENPVITGGGSARVTPYQLESFLDIAKREAEDPNGINYSPGYRLDGKPAQKEMTYDALDLASRSKKVLYFMGTLPGGESEGSDRADLLLPDEQIALLDHLKEVCKNIVIVLCVGAPVELPFSEDDQIKGILLSYFGGEGQSEAVYNTMLGKSNPSGHLAESWPTRLYTVPSFGFYPGNASQSFYYESIYVGYRYYLTADQEVRYPFGYGLSYSRFKFSDIVLSDDSIEAGEKIDAKVTVENLSGIPGEATVQIYIEPVKKKVFMAKRTLGAFAKVKLKAKEVKTITIPIPPRAFEHYDKGTKSFQIEGGKYFVEVGENCDAIKSKAALDIFSDFKAVSMRDRVPSYYAVGKEGFAQYEGDFERLLGRKVLIPKDRKARPFDLNSTMKDIEWTYVGKRLRQAFEKQLVGKSPQDVQWMTSSFDGMPIRNLAMARVKEKQIQAVLDLANGKPVSAFLHLLFRKRRRR